MIDLKKRIMTIDDSHTGNLILAEMIRYHGVQDSVIFFADMHEEAWDINIKLNDMGMNLGSHTMSHPHLIGLQHPMLEWELEESKKSIEELTGKPCEYLAYPYGDFNEQVKAVAKRVGYKAARTCLPDIEDSFNLKSFYLDGTQENFIAATKTPIRMYHLHFVSIENFNSYSSFNTFCKWLATENL